MNPKKGDLYRTEKSGNKLDYHFVLFKENAGSYVVVDYIHPFLRSIQLRGILTGKWNLNS